jgi:colanic acid biosynthesis glycosyl transferase WcaI
MLNMDADQEHLHTLIITQYYPPETHGAMPAALAQELARRGHIVHVVTTFPNHPHGRLFPGWHQRRGYREHDGAVTVRRVPMIVDHSSSALRRMVAYVSFGLSVLRETRAAQRADVVYVYCAQPTAAIPALLWRRFLGRPFVLHVQDIWPESVTGSDMLPPGLVSRAVGSVLLRALRILHGAAAGVVAISPGAARLLIERGADSESTSVCHNWGRPDAVVDRTIDQAPGTHVVYAGTMGPNQGLDAVIRAAARCADVADLSFTFVGDGIALDALQDLAARTGATNVTFRAAVTSGEMAAVHASADFEVVALKAVPMSAVTIPSKLQDAMAHGVPVIAAVSGDAADVVASSDSGLVVTPGDVDELEAAFRAAHASDARERARLSSNARTTARQTMHLDSATDHLEHVLRKAAA